MLTTLPLPAAPADTRFREFVEQSRDEIFIVDSDNVIEYMNPASARALGLPSSVVGRRLSECFPEPVASELEHAIDVARNTGTPTYSEREIPFPRGPRWMSAWLTPIDGPPHATGRTSVMGVARDITQRHELAHVLSRQHQVLDAIVAASPVGIMLVERTREWVCELANPVIRRLAGHQRLDGAPLREAWPDVAAVLVPVLEAAHGDQPQKLHVDAAARSLSIDTVRLHLPGREVESALIVVTDLTERRDLEQQLLQADKMDAIGRLAGGIAHDFNNLLTPILGYTELVAATLAPDDARRKDLEEVATAARSATALTRQLLAFSRKQFVAARPLDVNDVVRGIEGILRRTLGEDVHIALELSDPLDRTIADRHQIEQVVLNLCVNARDAMPNGGALSIRSANATLTCAMPGAREMIPPGRYVALAVSDTGTGIAPDVQEHMFEPFFTTKGSGKGTGLGLSIVYGIVTQAGGYVAVSSAAGRGTSFTIYLPRTDAAQEHVAEDASPSAGGASRGETILIVEDHDGLRRLAERLLRNEGYAPLVAQSAGEALELAQGTRGPIHLLLTDIVMPDVDGITLAAQLSKQRPDMGVLFMSGYSGADVTRYTAMPADAALVQKPFTRQSLTSAIRAALERNAAAFDLAAGASAEAAADAGARGPACAAMESAL